MKGHYINCRRLLNLYLVISIHLGGGGLHCVSLTVHSKHTEDQGLRLTFEVCKPGHRIATSPQIFVLLLTNFTTLFMLEVEKIIFVLGLYNEDQVALLTCLEDHSLRIDNGDKKPATISVKNIWAFIMDSHLMPSSVRSTRIIFQRAQDIGHFTPLHFSFLQFLYE